MPAKFDRDALHRVICEQILPALADGASMNEALARIPAPFPTRWCVMKHIRADPDLLSQFHDAVDARADVLADRIVGVANEPLPLSLTAAEAAAWTARQRLKFDALRWTASKLAPGRWSEAVQVDIAVDARISIAAALEAAQRRVDTIEAIEPEPAALLEDSRSRA